MDTNLDVAGLIVIIVFYLVILAVGVASSCWFKKKYARDGMTVEESNLVAGRKISGVVGVFTMTGLYARQDGCSTVPLNSNVFGVNMIV